MPVTKSVQSHGILERQGVQKSVKSYGPNITRLCQNNGGDPPRNTKQSGEPKGSGRVLRHKPQNGGQIEEAGSHPRSCDMIQAREVHGSDRWGRGHGRRFPQTQPSPFTPVFAYIQQRFYM